MTKNDIKHLAEAYEQVSNPAPQVDREKYDRLITFAKGISNHHLPKYKAAMQHFAGLTEIQSFEHERGIVNALVQIAQDPDSNNPQDVGYNTHQQIEGFLKRFYPDRVSEIKTPDPSDVKGKIGGAGVYY